MSSDLKANLPLYPSHPSADGAVVDLEGAGGPRRVTPPPATSRRRCQAFRDVVGRVSEALEQKSKSYWFLLILSAVTMVVSLAAASLLTRTYMESQDSRNVLFFFWFSSAGWPLTALLLIPLYALNKQGPPSQLFRSAPIKSIAWTGGLGALSAASNILILGMSGALGDNGELLYWAYHGCSLAVTSAIFGRFIAKNRFRSSINLVVVVTIAALIAAYRNTKPFVLDEDYDPAKFMLYFVFDLPGSVLRGLAFAITERIFFSRLRETTATRRGAAGVRATFLVVLEVTLLVSFFSFAFSSIGLVFVKQGIGRFFQLERARRFSGGKTAYYAVLLGSTVAFQLAAIAGTAVVCLASATYAGVLGAAAVTASGLVVANFFDADTLTGFSVLAFVLAVWGLLVHAYGRCRARR